MSVDGGQRILLAVILLLWSGCTSKAPVEVTSGRKQAVRGVPAGLADLTRISTVNSSRGKLIGSKSCAGCHEAEWKSYQLTAHSSALSLVDPSVEPADGTFVHDLSGRKYEVYRAERELRHRESSIREGSARIVDDRALKYLVGSGHHSRTYLVEEHGFLMESPITWYTARKEWDLSPGYDHPRHEGFARAIDDGCMYCHAGNFETVGGSQYRLKFHELAIGCERCHGPGKDHAELHAGKGSVGEKSHDSPADGTIVNPGRLSRELAESICSDCHLRGDATVFHRGSKLGDFLPGMHLTDVRIDYRIAQEAAEMKVVGHVEQMHASACYIRSDTLTCTTCHDPHRPTPATRTDYRETCLTCHEKAGCGLDEALRVAQAPGDDCLTCHMPQVKTDIPHIAFTHHRIGIDHQKSPSSATPSQLGLLQAILKKPGMTKQEELRSLGLGYLEISSRQPTEQLHQACLRQARMLLEASLTNDPADAEVQAGLGRIRWFDSLGAAEAYCLEAIKKPAELSPGARVNTLFILADCASAGRRPHEAIACLTQLTKLRENSEDWLLLSDCYRETGNESLSREALEQAAKISPFRDEIQDRLRTLRDIRHRKE